MVRILVFIITLLPAVLLAQIENGDFSVGSLGCSNVSGWTISNGSAAPEITFAFTGSNTWLDLTPCGAFGNGSWIEQEVATQPGQCYQLNFELGSVCGWDGSDAGVYITIDGMQLGERIFNDSMLCNPGVINFMPFTSPIFQANSNTTTIRFRGEGRCTALSVSIGGGCSSIGQLANPGVIGIDNISIEQISSAANWSSPIPEILEICPGQTTTLNASIGSSSATYTWNNGSIGSEITIDSPGFYEVVIEDGCLAASFSTEVILIPSPELELGNSIAGCYPNGVSIGQDYTNIEWQDGNFPTPRTIQANGLYIGFIENQCGSATDSISVELDVMPITDEIIESTICDGLTGQINIDLESPFSWIWPNGESDEAYTFTNSQYFVLPVSSPCGTVNFTIDLSVISCDVGVYIPNSFTPNGDGNNDIWQPIPNKVQITHCLIYNRWGEKIFESDQPHPVWVGDFKAGEYYCPDQMYNYQVSYIDPDGQAEIAIGHITLVR
jgi:gliding motility-associated-like protein